MPLQDSFKKRGAKSVDKPGSGSRPGALVAPPTIEDLRHSVVAAHACLRQPVVLTWKGPNSSNYLLTVACHDESYEPTWILHNDDKNKISIIWSYNTPDPELIYSLITEEVRHEGPAAVIPESLRPGTASSDGSALTADADKTETIFSEHYEIISTIGRGGMGVIYKARHLGDNSVVALKVLHSHLLTEATSISRFKQEAQAASGLQHPNLIAVREFGFSNQGQPFLAMDYLEGVELQTLLSHCSHLDLPSFINVFTQICDALKYAHEKGLIHRDLKPGNIMLVKDQSGSETVKIIDFGIAKSFGESGNRITTTGELIGSPAYMSPEQCGGAALDQRSDIYSLGCVMYEAITGILPFQHESALRTIMMQVNEPASHFAELCPQLGIPEELELIIFKALEKDPGDRYQSAEELSDDLWHFAAMGYASGNRTFARSFVEEEQSGPIGTNPADAPTSISLMPSDAQDHSSIENDEWIVARAQTQAVSNRALSLFRRAGILSDRLLEAAALCEHMLDEGTMTVDEAVAAIQSLNEGLAGPAKQTDRPASRTKSINVP